MKRRGVLVSVRGASEADAALAGGARVIDVKDPARGSLGRAEPGRVAAVAAAVGHRAPWTLAAGELADGVAPLLEWIARVLAVLPDTAGRPAAAKVGLAGMAGHAWEEGLARFQAGLPAGCVHVAVAYADFDRVGAPTPADVVTAAARLGCGLLLVDTADKRGPGLFGVASAADIARWVAAARAHGLGVALAGRISLREIPRAVAFAPDLVALRSAVCSNEPGTEVRLGRVSAELVAAAVAAACPVPDPVTGAARP